MKFSDIVGQSDIKARMMKSINEGFIPHAQLLCGPQGVGKLPLAIAYAQYLNCEKRTADSNEPDSCGTCPSCVKYNNLAHPDLHFVYPVIKKAAKKKELCDDYIAEWREFVKRTPYFSLSQWLSNIEAENSQGLIYAKESEEIIRKLSLRIYEAKYRVMIIWLPEKMHESCANKLLKIIEEPYDNTVFLLVSDAPDHVINTIQSRCQRINIPGIAKDNIVQMLHAQYNLTDDVATNIAHIANGSYLKAMETISLDEENKFFFSLFINMMRASYARNIKQIKTIGNDIAAVGRERQKNFLIYCQRMIREYFVKNLHHPEMVYLNQEEQEFGTRFASFVNERNIIDLMTELSVAERHIEQNVNAKMVFFDLCLKITMLIKR